MTLIGTLMLVRPEKSSHHLAIAISILCGSDRAETIPRTDISIRHAECGQPAFHEHVSEDRNRIAAAGLMKAVPMSLTDIRWAGGANGCREVNCPN